MTETKDADTYTIKGKVYTRVTRVLAAQGLIDFSNIPERDRQFYLDRGTENHRLWQQVEEGVDGKYTYDERVEAYRAGHAKFLRETGFRALPGGIELRIKLDQFMVAGTLDRLGTIQNRLILIDYKSSHVHDWTRLQTAIYLLGLNYKFHEVERRAVAFFNNGKYQLSNKYPFSDRDEAIHHLTEYRKENPHDAAH